MNNSCPNFEKVGAVASDKAADQVLPPGWIPGLNESVARDSAVSPILFFPSSLPQLPRTFFLGLRWPWLVLVAALKFPSQGPERQHCGGEAAVLRGWFL
jgi:hypothetical protein